MQGQQCGGKVWNMENRQQVIYGILLRRMVMVIVRFHSSTPQFTEEMFMFVKFPSANVRYFSTAIV